MTTYRPPKLPRYKTSDKYRRELLAEADQIQRAYKERSPDDFLLFTRGLTIEGQQGPQVFERCMAPFQRACFEDLALSLHALRDAKMPEHRRWWIERTKKAGKDSDLAIVMLWVIAFPRNPFYAQIGAANKEQASIVKDRMTVLLHRNAWLNDFVEIVQWEVRSKKQLANGSPMATCDIMSSDISGAHGGFPNLLIINELSHVQKWEFIQNLMDNADGVARGMVIVATNAGIKGTKCEVWRNNAIVSEQWEVHCLSKPAPWHTRETIEDAKKRNTSSRFKRLWEGLWTSGKGDALDEGDISRCFRLKKPMLTPEPGWVFIGGLDLGIHHDHSALVILGINRKRGKIRTAYWKAWIPQESGGEVDLTEVEDVCYKAQSIYNLQALYYDPTEARLMAQRMRNKIPLVEMSFSKHKNINLMAETLIQVVESVKLECYDDMDGTLRRDFGKFNIVEKSYGYKLEAVSDEFGHADVGTALVIALPAAVQFLEGKRGLMSDDVLIDEEDEELTKEEREEMPDELKDIYDMDDEFEDDYLLRKRRDPFEDVL